MSWAGARTAAEGADASHSTITRTDFAQRLRAMLGLRKGAAGRPSSIALGGGPALPAYDAPLGMLRVPLRHMRRRRHHAAHRRDLAGKRDDLLPAHAGVVDETGGEDDGDHGGRP